jgi:glycosyltransferase involved in cell wall biosynthesis
MLSRKKLAIVTTHPIQYYVPLYQALAKEADLMVFYTWGEASMQKYDPGFGKVIEWDIPLLDGYHYCFVQNTSKQPGSHHFKGIVTPTLIAEIGDFKPDAILVIGYAYKSHLKVMRHFHGKIPVWFRGDSNLLDDTKGWKKYLKTAYLKWVYKNVDVAFYVGTNNKAYFKKYGLKDQQLIFAPHAVDNKRFAENRKDEAEALRLQLAVNKADILILFAGKLEPKKDPELLLEAFMEAVNAQNNNASTPEKKAMHLLFVGNGVLEQQLKQRAATFLEQNATSNACIHFMDFQNQSKMPVAYQACDIFCLPSKGPGETWGLAINEAMAASRPIIASNKVGCATDLVLQGYNGIVFQAGSKTALKQAIQSLSSVPLAQMGQASSELISNWTIEIQAKQILNKLHE